MSTSNFFLEKIKYDEHGWNICADLKVVAIVMGLQRWWAKYSCFKCLWDTRYSGDQYEINSWPERSSFTTGENSVINPPLIEPEKGILPALHIKLGLMKQFVKAMKETSPVLSYLKSQFSKFSDSKRKEGIFVGAQIRKLFNDGNFEEVMNLNELRAWLNFKIVVRNFLGKKRKDPTIKTLSKCCLATKVWVAKCLKLHFMHAHLDFFRTT